METKRRPHYWQGDSLHLFSKADGPFYLQLADRNILRQLRSLRSSAVGYEKYLSQYPETLCAPLDLLYVFRRAACTLDEELLQDLLFAYSWREANWGSWLAALAPSKLYESHLQRRKPTLPEASVIVELAIAACGEQRVPPELDEHWSLLSEIRNLTEQLPRVTSPLRPGLTVEDEQLMHIEFGAVRAAYQSGSEAEARALMQQQKLGLYFLPHVAWAKTKYHAA